jgi:hypothetical protein
MPFYYSIVTNTTLGFGDVTANNWAGKIFIISEVIIAYFTLGLLLVILANTIASFLITANCALIRKILAHFSFATELC